MLEKPDDTIFQGNDIVLRCEAVGLPLPSVTWASNSPANLSMEFFIQYSVEYNDRQNFLVVSELTLRNAMLSLRGRYTCIANNSLGIGEDHTTLVINGKKHKTTVRACCVVFVYSTSCDCNIIK